MILSVGQTVQYLLVIIEKEGAICEDTHFYHFSSSKIRVKDCLLLL